MIDRIKNLLFSFAFIGISLILTGYVMSSKPQNDTGFQKINTIDQIEGCYSNFSVVENENLKKYLSTLIWPNSDLDHSAIEIIRVNRLTDRSLQISGESLKNIYKNSTLKLGEDFNLSNGKITIENKPVISLAYPSGNPFVGVAHGSIVLGLDTEGNARLKESATLLGTAFIVFPVAGHSSEVVLFERDSGFCES